MKNHEQLPVAAPNARELHIIEFVAGLHAQVQQGEEMLKKRLDTIPGGVEGLQNRIQPNQQGAGSDLQYTAHENPAAYGPALPVRRSGYPAEAHDQNAG
jgi:hypothetical protein